MKKFIQWLAKIFNANIEVVREVKVYVEKPVYIQADDVLEGDIYVRGNLAVKGAVKTTGEVSAGDVSWEQEFDGKEEQVCQ